MRFDSVDELIKFANSHVYEYELVSHAIDDVTISAIFKKRKANSYNYNYEFAKYPTYEQIEYGKSVNYS